MSDDRIEAPARRRLDPALPVVFLLVVCLGLALAYQLLRISGPEAGLAKEVASRLQRSGVTSPVTAVLLNFRGYDTLLEVMVLFLTVVGVWSMARVPFPPRVPDTSPIQTGAVRVLTPLMCLVAGCLVWQGSHLAGGAFQGGAVLAAAGVLLLVSDLPLLRGVSSPSLRFGLTLGPVVFLGIAFWCMVVEGFFLAYPPGMAGGLLLVVESACAVSIGITLAALFAGGRPVGDSEEAPDDSFSVRNGEEKQ